jgi:hypothetical protein
MRFTPRTEKEVSNVFEKGKYKFSVISAKETVSKSQNEMLNLTLVIYHNSIPGKSSVVNCYLLTDNPSFEYMIRHFCYSVGLENQYESGVLIASDCIGKEGIVSIGIDVDKTGQYSDKNKVLDFIIKENNEVKPVVSTFNNISINLPKNNDINDEVPFF